MITYTCPIMRAHYLKMNGITHAFSWKEGSRHYVLHFGDKNCTGWPEGRYSTMRTLKEDLAKHYPELLNAFYRANH